MELQKDFYVGVVEENIDKIRKGRLKVRVQTLYHDIPVEDLPYAYPFAGLAGKEFQVPEIGKLVNILFLSDDLYSPYYIYSENYNINLQNKLKDLNDDDYTNFSALLFDESTQIYVDKDELTIDQLLNKITINNKSINLELKDFTQKIYLGTRGGDQHAVLGKNFFEWMDKFMNELLNPSSLIDSSGAAISRPKLIKLCQEYKSSRDTFVSDYVKIVNNGEIKRVKRYPDTINNRNDIDLVIPPEENTKLQKKLNNSIQKQNKQSCEKLKKSAPTSIVPLPEGTIYGAPGFLNGNMITLQPNVDKTQLIPVWDTESNDKINTLHPNLREYAIQFLNRCYAKGIKLKITEALRTAEQQIALQKSGKAARPGYSYHEYGLAIDVSPVNSSDWDSIGQIGESLGFRWGRHFRNPRREDWHFDMGFGLSSKELKHRVEKGYLSQTGYVDLEGSESTPINNNQYLGQNYITAPNSTTNINEPCGNTSDFNSSNENEKKKNLNNQSDENEKKPSSVAEIKQTLPCPAQTILDLIIKGEGTDYKKVSKEKGAKSTYDITLSYGKYLPSVLPGTTTPVQPISNLTLGEIKIVQDQMKLNGGGSNAVGKYQIIKDTLLTLQNILKLDDNTIFSPEIQDKMAYALLVRRGYNRWLSESDDPKKKLSNDNFHVELAKEWASIGVPTNITKPGGIQIAMGESYYGNTGKESVGTTYLQMRDTLIEAKQEKC